MQLSDVVRIALIFSEDAKRYAKKLAGSIDLSGKADKKKPSKAGNLAALDANGNLADSGKAGANVAVKAKPSKAGNLAALTADGSLSGSAWRRPIFLSSQGPHSFGHEDPKLPFPKRSLKEFW